VISAEYEFKGSAELGLLKVRDKGTSGYEFKGPTALRSLLTS